VLIARPSPRAQKVKLNLAWRRDYRRILRDSGGKISRCANPAAGGARMVEDVRWIDEEHGRGDMSAGGAARAEVRLGRANPVRLSHLIEIALSDSASALRPMRPH